jgi:hypothetical protein
MEIDPGGLLPRTSRRKSRLNAVADGTFHSIDRDGLECGVGGVAMRYRFLTFVLFSLSVAGLSETQNGAGAAALARIRTFAGNWEGTFEWTGARAGTGNMSATYSQTGNGSVVVEDLAVDGVRSMTSVYHLDGADLWMTHYCAAQNQPRLKAQRIDMTQGAVDFAFVDATNLRSPDAPHVHGFEMRFLDSDHIVLTFLFQGGDQHSRERIKLTRVRPKPSDKP